MTDKKPGRNQQIKKHEEIIATTNIRSVKLTSELLIKRLKDINKMAEERIPTTKTEIIISMDNYMEIMQRLQQLEFELAKVKKWTN